MKNTILQILKFIGAFAIGGLIGLVFAMVIVVLFTHVTFQEFMQGFLDVEWGELLGAISYSLLCGVIAIFAHIILHEGGHLVAGLMSGYKFVSFRIGSFTLLHLNGKLQIKKFSIAGTAGQCLMMPPQRPIEQIGTSFYNLGGILSNLIFALASLALFPVIDNAFARIFLSIFAIIGFLLALVNGIPLKIGGISNDGNNVLYLNKNQRSKAAFVYQLITNALVQDGTRPKELPAEYLSFDTDIDYKDPLQVNHLLLSASTWLDKMQYEDCYTILNVALQHKKDMVTLFTHEIVCEVIYTALLTGRIDEARTLFDKDIKQYVEQHKEVMSAKQRLLCAWSYYAENDKVTAQEIYNKVYNNRHNYLMQGEVAMDIALMQEFLSDRN